MIKSSPLLEIQKSIFNCLTLCHELLHAIGSDKIFERVPVDTSLPYITFGKGSFYDWSTDSDSGFEYFFTLHVWVDETEKETLLTIAGILSVYLPNVRVDMQHYNLVSIKFDSSEIRHQLDSFVYQGIVRFRAIIEEKLQD